MAQSQGFDVSRLSTAAKILLGASAIYVIDSFLPYWNRICVSFAGFEGGCAGVGLWNGIGVLTGLLVLGLLVWEGLRAAGVLKTMPEKTASLVSAGLAAGVVLFTLLKIVIDSTALSFGAWLGIVLALAIGYGGYMRWIESKAAPGVPPAAAPPPPPPAGGGGGFTG